MGRDEFLPLVVQRVVREADDIVSLTLARPDGQPLPGWQPGAHVDVQLPAGGGDLLRQYSLCSEPGVDSWRIAVLRELAGRGGLSFVHDHLAEGDTLLVGAPRNNFTLTLGAGRHVFVAGGIGVTPLLPMLGEAERSGADWTLLYLATNAQRMAFVEELRGYGDRVHLHLDEDSGVIDLAATLDHLGAADGRVYGCGPAGLLAALERYAAGQAGCDLVLERFTADPDVATSHEDDHAFAVELADGTEIAVAADETVLAALTREGVQALSSCQEGICGTCETPVISGEIDHRDQLLSDEEREAGDTMMVCVSRCRGDRLVLDI